MSVLRYPLLCIYPVNLQRIQSTIFQWLLDEVKVHFMYQDHINCCQNFTATKLGDDPERKIVLIHPDLDIEVNALLMAFNIHIHAKNYIPELFRFALIESGQSYGRDNLTDGTNYHYMA